MLSKATAHAPQIKLLIENKDYFSASTNFDYGADIRTS